MIRPATAMDAPGIGDIWNTAIRETTITFNPVEKTEPEIIALTTGENPFFIWEKNHRILGFATYFPFRPGIGYQYAVEYSIVLHGNARGQGVGRALVAYICDHARMAGKHALIGVVSGENTAGLAVHTALGFVPRGTLPAVGRKCGRWLDAVFMQKQL